MVKKRGKLLFPKLFYLTLLILLIEIGILIYTNRESVNQLSKGLTGNAVNGIIAESYSSMSFSSRVFLVIQWTVIILLLFGAALRDRAIKNSKPDESETEIDYKSKNKTDIDILYETLQEKKQLKISSISDLFNIDKNIAMEWGKALETGDLAYIDYPGFGGPVLVLKEEDNILNLKKPEEILTPERPAETRPVETLIKPVQPPAKPVSGKPISIPGKPVSTSESGFQKSFMDSNIKEKTPPPAINEKFTQPDTQDKFHINEKPYKRSTFPETPRFLPTSEQIKNNFIKSYTKQYSDEEYPRQEYPRREYPKQPKIKIKSKPASQKSAFKKTTKQTTKKIKENIKKPVLADTEQNQKKSLNKSVKKKKIDKIIDDLNKKIKDIDVKLNKRR